MNNCDFCPSEAVDSMVFESGNNAEIPVEVSLCEVHMNEQEAIGYDFDAKYADQILKLAEESLYDQSL